MELWLHYAAAELEFSRLDVLDLIGLQIVMAKEIHDALIVAGGQSEELDEPAVAAVRGFQSPSDERTHLCTVQIAVDEGAMHRLPEGPLRQHIGTERR